MRATRFRPGDDDAPRDLTILAEGQAETSPPEQASGYFRVRMTAEAEDERHSWTQAWVPADAVVRFRDDEREGGYVWLTLSEQTQAALERASDGLRPIAGSKLRGLDVKPPSVTVHEVVPPPAEAVAPSAGGNDDSVPEAILALVGAGSSPGSRPSVCSACDAGGARGRRRPRRRGSVVLGAGSLSAGRVAREPRGAYCAHRDV